MNRAFKRLIQGGILNVSDTVIKFTFEGKSYSALEGDTIKMALLANNIMNHSRSKAGYFLSSSAGLYPVMTNIAQDDTSNHIGNHIIACDDFKITNGLKLSQTNKSSLRAKLLFFTKFFKASAQIPQPIIPTKAHDLTRSFIHDIVPERIKSFVAAKSFNVEKTYIHTDIVITGMNIFALQAAFILAEADFRVIMCDTHNDNAFNVFENSELKSSLRVLLEKVHNHKNITIKKMTDICVAYDDTKQKGRIIGINHDYQYHSGGGNSKNNTHHIELLVINANKILYAPSLQEMGFLFQNHHLPAVMGCREFIDLHIKFGLIVNHNIVIYASNDMAYDILSVAGMTADKVNAIIDTRPTMTQAMIDAEKAGFKIYAGYVVTHATGKESVESVVFKSLRGDKEGLVKSVACDLLLCSAGYELDMSMLDNTPQALRVCVSDTYQMSVMPNEAFLSKHNITLIGYHMHHADANSNNDNHSVYDICQNILKEYGVVLSNPDKYADDSCLQPQLSKTIIWQQPEFYAPHDLCRKDSVLFPQDIQYNDFIHILYRYDNPLMVIDALTQQHNFNGNHRAIRILLTQMQKIYNFTPSDIATFYQQILSHLASDFGLPASEQITDKISTCGQPKLHIMPFPDAVTVNHNNEIITPDCTMSALDIEQYYHKIKNYVGVRSFNNRDIIDISGHDVVIFIQKIIDETNHDCQFPILNVGEHFFIPDKNSKTAILIMHYINQRYCAVIPQDSDFKTVLNRLYTSNIDLNLVVNDISQGWAYLQLVGQQAESVMQKIVKQPLSSLLNDTMDLWIENIQIRFVRYNRFDIPHIDMLIISDAACAFYQKLTDDIFQIAPFGQPIYDMFALEAGQIFDTPLVTQNKNGTLFTTQALAMPLVKLDNTLHGGDIYPDKYHLDEKPQGITVSNMIYSPYYNQYVFPTLLNGDFHQWENKIVSVISKDKQHATQVKIISDKMLRTQEVA